MLEIQTLKRLLGFTEEDTSKDFELEFILQDTESKVLNYCHLEEVPVDLKMTCYKMAIDIYRNESIGASEITNHVVSISEGDTSVSYKQNQKQIDYAQSILNDYSVQLNRFRKMVWE